jgi:hypothetical protein
MNEITVGELRELLANMPADSVLRVHDGGDEPGRLELVPPGKEYGRWLEHLQPGDNWEDVEERDAERERLVKEAGELFRRMLGYKPGA